MAQNDSPQVGFAGLGAMGYGMVSNLLKAGFSVTGFDLSPVALEKFRNIGGKVATSIAEASKDQSKFLVMVATPGQVDSILFGQNGLSQNLPASAILCLFSTLPPSYVAGLPARLAKDGRGDIRIMDCPVSGGVVGAIAGSLSIMIAGESSTYDEVKAELKAVSAPGRLFYCGALGAASTMKMLNQHLAGSHIVATAETLSLAASLGLSTGEARRVLVDSVATSWMMGDRGGLMLSADWAPRSAVTIFTKDLGIVCESADNETFPSPIASTSLQLFIERAARGFGGDDDASVVCNYEELIGKTIKGSNQLKLSPPTTPPGETSYKTNQNFVGATVLGEGSEALRAAFPAPRSSSTQSSGVFLLSLAGDDSGLAGQLETIPENSIVGITGTSDSQRLKAVVDSLKVHHPTHHFVDCHVLPSAEKPGYQFLFTADSPSISAAVQELVQPYATPVPVSGKVGSATAMYLVVRLGTLLHVAAAAECCGLAVAKKVSPQIVHEIIGGAAGSSAMFRTYFHDMMNKRFDGKALGEFGYISSAMRDLETLIGLARSLRFPSRLLDTVYQIFKGIYRKTPNKESSLAAVVSYWE
ncbi:hypothetical protein GQ53DRAFT_841600 [Thozetella sp. PMI_491]|nr:hypothetical protein GQ53DRAFT_841600 [Thozetella sp. PMI_491]